MERVSGWGILEEKIIENRFFLRILRLEEWSVIYKLIEIIKNFRIEVIGEW